MRGVGEVTITGADLQDELFEIEQGFWLKGEEYFLGHVDERCLLAFPQMPDFHGVHSREEVAATAKQPSRWSDLKMSSRQMVRPGEDVAVLSYVTEAKQADGKPYKAMIGSAYAKRGNGWKLAFHQHSPI
jgi:hypothetical protein